MSKGIIYCMSTAVKGLVKIGKTNDFKNRMRGLESDGYKNVAGLKREFAIEVEDYEEKELLIHHVFNNNRVGDTELFAIDLDLAIMLLSSLDGTQIYPENKTKSEVFEQATNTRNIECIPDGKYFMSITPKGQIKKYNATLEKKGNTLLLLAGSDIFDRNSITVDKWSKAKKNAQVENNKLLKDIKCDSPSMAASLVTGTHSDGWTWWKTEEGKEIDIYR